MQPPPSNASSEERLRSTPSSSQSKPQSLGLLEEDDSGTQHSGLISLAYLDAMFLLDGTSFDGLLVKKSLGLMCTSRISTGLPGC
jgi:hypothetical protein